MSNATLDSAFLDLELQAEVHLRPERVPLGELCTLSAGDLFSLEHRPDEPVELFVNGRSVARGELIVVDGQFGIRITQAGPGDEVAAEAASEAASQQAATSETAPPAEHTATVNQDATESAAAEGSAESTPSAASRDSPSSPDSEEIPGLDAAEEDKDAE